MPHVKMPYLRKRRSIGHHCHRERLAVFCQCHRRFGYQSAGEKGEGDQVTTEIVLFERIKAPLKAGDKVGELIALKDSAEVGRYPLVADGDVEVAKLHEIYIRMLKTLI